MSVLLSAQALTKNFDHFRAVNAIDFEVKKGECFGMLGPNGAGKTTTIKMIYGALSPSSGRLDVFGLPINHHRREIKQRMGIVMQRDIHEESLSTWDNLRIHGHHYGLSHHTLSKKGKELLELLQLQEKTEEIVFRLSSGMKRRLSIAKGMMNEPELLLLDEPTTGLDPQARHLLWEKIGQIKKEGTTILITTHYMQEAEVLCDTLIILDHGHIIERGSPRELIQKHGKQNLEEVFIELTGRELRD